VKTPDGSVSAVTITSSPQIPILDPITGLYYVEETTESTGEGSEGNVALGTLTAMTPVISQATSTSNVSLIRSGVNEESNDSLVTRVKEVRKGRNYPTELGLRRLATGALEDSPLEFVDAKVIGPTHELMTRALAGAVDLYVVGKDLEAFTEVIPFQTGVTAYVLGLQPVENVANVIGAVTGAVTFTFLSDVSGGFSGSTRAGAMIQITQPENLLDGEAMAVSYNYDSAIRTAQDLVSTGGEFHVPNMDLLFRQARQATIAIELEVIQFGDRPQADVQADVQTDLAAFFAGGTTSTNQVFSPKSIGEDIDESDIVALVAAIDDVDRITLVGPKAMVIKKNGVTSTTSPVSIEDNEYARLGTVTFL
jgi:hypothetical protein